MINMLIDLLPETVDIGGEVYLINTDFRTSILFEMMMQDPDLLETEKVRKAIALYYSCEPDDIAEAVDKLLWFYTCGREEKTGKPEWAEEEEPEEQKQIYSFEHDAPYIYAGFLEQYGIDLQEVEDLHWWKFRAMFNSLNEDCKISKIMEYRGIQITNDMTKSQKKFYRRMKQVYALPIPDSEQEKQDAITKALMNGEDLMGLL